MFSGTVTLSRSIFHPIRDNPLYTFFTLLIVISYLNLGDFNQCLLPEGALLVRCSSKEKSEFNTRRVFFARFERAETTLRFALLCSSCLGLGFIPGLSGNIKWKQKADAHRTIEQSFICNSNTKSLIRNKNFPRNG